MCSSCLCGRGLDTHHFRMPSWGQTLELGNTKGVSARVKNTRKQGGAEELVEHNQLRAAGCSWVIRKASRRLLALGRERFSISSP